jgi:SAM-dependent methyltransferase
METTATITSSENAGHAHIPVPFKLLYYEVRKKENRIYTDEETARLPDIAPGHPHYHEWQIRKQSFRKLIKYLSAKNRQMNILEAGCGNGWLSAGLALNKHFRVTGMDVNTIELEQANRVFGHRQNLRFIDGDILQEMELEDFFDVIIFAASIQYFPSLTELLNRSLNLLRLQGEIHILDSHFYTKKQVPEAKKRSREYYAALGFPDMARYYFHHCPDDLKSFDYTILYRPDFLHRRILGNKNPFYWIKIRQS